LSAIVDSVPLPRQAERRAEAAESSAIRCGSIDAAKGVPWARPRRLASGHDMGWRRPNPIG
jgi:hypothetical protein